MNKRTFLRGAVVSCVGCAAGAVQAQALPRLRYGGDAAFAPFESLDAQGRPQGFLIDLLAELGHAMGVAFDVSLRPWAQTEAAFRQGQVDLVAMVDTAQRRQWARFTRGFATPALGVYLRRGQPEPQGLRDLLSLRLAVLDGEAMRETLAHGLDKETASLLRLPDAGQALAAVQQGRAEAALLPRAYADPLLAAGAASAVVAGQLNLTLQTYALAVAPGQEALQARLQQGLDALESDGRLEALRLRWLSSHRDLAARGEAERGLARQRDWTWGLAGASVAALAMAGAVVWRRGQRIAAERQRRRNVEDALRSAEELLAHTFAQNPEPMLIVGASDGVVRDANAALLSLLGVAADDLIGHALPTLGEHVDTQALQQIVQTLDSAGTLQAMPLSLRRADGGERECLVSADRLVIDGAEQVFCLVRDVTDQLAHDVVLRSAYDALSAELAQSRRELEAAREGQVQAVSRLHEFTRAVAHDLRTPLNAVQGHAGLLRQRLMAGHVAEAMRHGEQIGLAARRMNSMISALTRLAQVARQPLKREPVDMARLAQETWSLLVAAHPERRADFRLEALPVAQADPDLAAHVWQNLLDNASKYSARAAEAKVRVDSHQDARGTWYRVTDNGAGFDMARAGQLFQPFQRLHDASQFEGSGVGLSLVRRVIDHHGGEIRLRSAPGVGTVAEFTLDEGPGTA